MHNNKYDYENSNSNSTLMAAMVGALAGIAFMAFTDRGKRRQILSTAQNLKTRASDTAQEIKDDVNNMVYNAQGTLNNEKEKIKEDLEDTGFKRKSSKSNSEDI